MTPTPSELSRRQVIKAAAATGVALATPSIGLAEAAPAPQGKSMIGHPFDRHETIRVGFIGTGGRGTSLLGEMLAVGGVQVLAICDNVASHAEGGAKLVKDSGQPAPELYTRGDHDFERLCQRDDLDVVFIATPWIWHVPMATFAMNHGKHVAVEVPAARTLKDCWDLVDTSERTRRHCTMLENCCYGYNELIVLNMVRAGLLGDLTHGGAAYNHDLRSLLFEDAGEGLWRRAEHLKRNGNLYPTHGLGPVAHYMDINRGDRFDYLVAMSTPSLGLQTYRREHLKSGDPKQAETYACGDLNTSLIKTAQGRTITLEHNVSSPQPYDRINLVAGTKGIFRDYPARVYLDEQPEGEEFTNLDKYKAKHEHPLWTKEGEMARTHGGHGGMDFVMMYRYLQCMREGVPPDMDVYDAAAWSVPGPLSEASVAKGSAPMKFPDFTRGGWQEKRSVL